MDNNSEKSFSLKAASAYLLCVLTAFVIMLVCTRSSPLYAVNNWDDSNSYFTVGKSIFKGLVPYRDLFDQKGMMLYTMYGIASLISYKTFLGVFVIETIAAAINCIAIYRIFKLYMRPGISAFLMPITAAIIYSTRSFWWGGSAEELMMPLFMWGMYLSIRYFKEEYPKPVSAKTLITGGILAGCVLNIKFNSLGFFFAWMVMILIADLTIDPARFDELADSERNDSGQGRHNSFSVRIQRCIVHGLLFLLGMLIATIPWIIYFAVKGALYDWFHVYIYLNIFVYSEKLPFATRLYNMCKIIYNHMLSNPYCGILTALGMAGFVVMKSRWIEKLNVVMIAGFTALLIFIGGVELQYYSLPLWTFAVLGVVAIGRIAEYMISNTVYKKKQSADVKDFAEITNIRTNVIRMVLGLCAVTLAGIVSYSVSMNTFFMKYSRDDIWIYHFTDTIESSGIESPTLINMGCFDAGLYTTCGIVPTCRFFQTQTIKISDVGEVQGDFIRNGKTDFVLVRDSIPANIDDHYELVMEEDWEQSGNVSTFYLYRLVK